MAGLWRIHTIEGPSLRADELVGVLEVHHTRTLALWGSLTADQWSQPSRNQAWTIHETARHAADALEVGTARLTDIASPLRLDGFDPNTTPDEWLARSDGETPADTIDRYFSTARQSRVGVAERMARGDNSVTGAPYGEAHWATLVVHLLWDSWLHERDIAFPLGLDAPSTPDEQRLVGLYAVLMALVPLQGADPAAEHHLALGGDIDSTIRGRTDGGGIDVREVSEPCEMGADAPALIDSLSGRGTPITELIPEIPEPLTLFAAYLSS
jgi:DinB family protein